MKLIAMSAAAMLVPAAAQAQPNACGQLNGVYASARLGSFAGTDAHYAFERMLFRAGRGGGHQILMPSATDATGKHVVLTVTQCQPVAPNQVRLTIASAEPGKPPYGTSTTTVTVFEGGARLRFVGDAPNPPYPGWMFRIPNN